MQALTKKLLELWHELISGDHHKNGDCHFYIEKNFSTYRKSKWRLHHCGYLIGDCEETFSTYKEAEKGLQDLLIEQMLYLTEYGENDTQLRVRRKVQAILEGDDSPADEPSKSERR